MRRALVPSLVLVFTLADGLSEAQGASPVGEEFVVSSDEHCDNTNPSAAGLKGGGFVAVWKGCDGSGEGIRGQLYTAAGLRVGDEFGVNEYTLKDQSTPSVARLTDGGFVVVWATHRNGTRGVRGQLFNEAGERDGGEFRVGSLGALNESSPSVARLTNGGFVVTWPNRREIYALRYNAKGQRVGPKFRVNTDRKLAQRYSEVAGLKDGGFVVTWTSIKHDHSESDVYGKQFTARGEPVGGEFRVNTYTKLSQEVSGVADLKDGRFVIVWQSYKQDDARSGIYGQRYTSSSKQIGNEFRVNSFTLGNQFGASVAGLKDGGFVVTWYSRIGRHRGAYGQQYGATGERIAAEFRITQHAAYPTLVSVAGLESGGFLVTWLRQLDESPFRYVIYGRLYDAE